MYLFHNKKAHNFVNSAPTTIGIYGYPVIVVEFICLINCITNFTEFV